MLSSCAIATAELPTVGKPQPLVLQKIDPIAAEIGVCYPA